MTVITAHKAKGMGLNTCSLWGLLKMNGRRERWPQRFHRP